MRVKNEVETMNQSVISLASNMSSRPVSPATPSRSPKRSLYSDPPTEVDSDSEYERDAIRRKRCQSPNTMRYMEDTRKDLSMVCISTMVDRRGEEDRGYVPIDGYTNLYVPLDMCFKVNVYPIWQYLDGRFEWLEVSLLPEPLHTGKFRVEIEYECTGLCNLTTVLYLNDGLLHREVREIPNEDDDGPGYAFFKFTHDYQVKHNENALLPADVYEYWLDGVLHSKDTFALRRSCGYYACIKQEVSYCFHIGCHAKKYYQDGLELDSLSDECEEDED
jgi:hypothetical protein